MKTELDETLEGSDRLINFVQWSSEYLGIDCPLYDDILYLMFSRLECDEPTSKTIDSFMHYICSKVLIEDSDNGGILKN